MAACALPHADTATADKRPGASESLPPASWWPLPRPCALAEPTHRFARRYPVCTWAGSWEAGLNCGGVVRHGDSAIMSTASPTPTCGRAGARLGNPAGHTSLGSSSCGTAASQGTRGHLCLGRSGGPGSLRWCDSDDAGPGLPRANLTCQLKLARGTGRLAQWQLSLAGGGS